MSFNENEEEAKITEKLEAAGSDPDEETDEEEIEEEESESNEEV